MRQALAARHQFLQLELDAQSMVGDPEARRRHIVEGVQALLATFVNEAGAAEGQAGRERQLEEQLSHLRGVIDNQHEVMKELKALLKESMGDVPEVAEVLRKLEDAEAQSLQVQQSLQAMGGAFTGGEEHAPDTDMLRDLIGNQQQTISNLQHMMADLIPEAEASEGLRQAIDKMQRSNQELGTCILVLEDENTRLRDQVETLQKKVDELANDVVEPVEGAPTPTAEEPGDEPARDGMDEAIPDEDTDAPAEAGSEAMQEEGSAGVAPPAAEADKAKATEEGDELGLDAFVELDADGGAPGQDSTSEREVQMPSPEEVALEGEDMPGESTEQTVSADDIDALLEAAGGEAPASGKDAATG